jgi:hypothetical protein
MSVHDRSSAQNGGKINHKFERFIERLLSSPSVENAAQSVGISLRTGWRWMRDPAVIARLAELRRQSMQHAMLRLQAAEARP